MIISRLNNDTGDYVPIEEESPVLIDEAFSIHPQMDGSYVIRCTGALFIEPSAGNEITLRISDCN